MASPFFPDRRSDFTEVKHEKAGKDTRVYFRFGTNKAPNTPSYPIISLANLMVSEQAIIGERGSSAFQLYLTIHVVPGEGNRYDATVTRAEVDAKIWISPKTAFETLAKFKPCYDDYAKNGKAAARKYLERHSGQQLPDGSMRGGHWSTSFHGLRAKTMRHELDHVAFAIQEGDGLVYNFVNQSREQSRLPSEWSPQDRVEAHIDRWFGKHGFANFDVGGENHKAIAIRDFFFMIAWYEVYELGMEKKSPAAYDAYIAAIMNYDLKNAMEQLGESFPWL